MSKKLASLIIKINANGAQAEKELKTLEKKVNDFGKSMQNFGKNMSKYVTVPLTALAAASVKLADTQLQAEAKLLNALNGREDVQKRLMAQASEMQSRALFGDEAIIEQQAFLAALGLSEQQISDTIEAAMQLSAALGMDLTSATKNLAKTYGGMTGELGESIPALKNLTTEELKAGEAIKFVNENYKGFAETAAKTGAGSLVQLKNKLGDLAEKIGIIILPVLDKLVQFANKFADYLSSLPDGMQRAIVGIGAVAAAIGPFAMGIGTLVLKFDALVALIPKLGSALTWLAAHPIAIAITAIAALATNMYMAQQRHEAFMKQLKEQKTQDYEARKREQYERTYNEFSRPIYSDADILEQMRIAKEVYYQQRNAFIKYNNGGELTNEQKKAQNVERQIQVALYDILQQRKRAAEDAAAMQASYNDTLKEVINQGDVTNGLVDDLKSITKSDKITLPEIKWEVGGPKASPLEKSFDIEAWKRKFLPMADEMVAMIDSLNSAVSSAFGNLASAMGEGIEAAITGDEFKPMQRLMLIIGDMLKQMGAALVAYATAMEAFKAAFKNPWVALGAGLAAIAAGATITGLAKKGIPKLATGGLAYTPTLAVVGDNAGAANDPEVIAPLSKLRSYMGGTKLELVGDIKWELRGDTLRAVLNRDNVRLKTLG